ncbi:MAG: hypothetical protein AB1767_09940 [Bacillota bacterium]
MALPYQELALLIFGLMECRDREAMKKETGPLIIPGKVKTFNPTGKNFLKVTEGHGCCQLGIHR